MRVVQLCGRAPNSLPIPEIPGAERWVLGAAHGDYATYDRVFDVHPVAWIQQRRPDAWAWYATQDKPVYLLDRHPDIPTSVRYPLESLQIYGSRGACALSSSIDHMMALAILEGFEDIRLQGIRMIGLEEWVTQRECLAYWIGRAEGMGIAVETDPLSSLCTPETLYGFSMPTGARRAPGQPVLVFGVPQG
jgi:hypothetical protein